MSEQKTTELIDVEAAIKGLRVLYVEDDRAILEAVQKPLSRRVSELYMATNGKEGLHIFSLYKPDIVITDIRMPIMDGLKMSRLIKEQSPQTPIIIVSAFNEAEYYSNAFDIGVCQYVFKPIDIDKLFVAVEQCVRNMLLQQTVTRQNQDNRSNLKMLSEYKNAIDLSSVVCKTDEHGVITEINNAFTEVSNYSPSEIVGMHYSVMLHPQLAQQTVDDIKAAFAEKRVYKGVVHNQNKKKYSDYVNLTIVPILSDDGGVTEYIFFMQEVTQLINRIYTDAITNYPNRAALARDILQAPLPLTAIFNIDDFRKINDFYGNHIGDEVLSGVINAFKTYLAQQSFEAQVYKLSADEFGVLVFNQSLCEGTRDFLLALRSYIESGSYSSEDIDIMITISAGFSLSKEDAIIKADMALSVAKHGRRGIVCYEEMPDIKKDYERNLILTRNIRQAIEDDRIVPWFQPILDVKTKEIVKYECLMRLVDRNGTVLLPSEFLNVAYKTRLYFKMAQMMISKSCLYFQNKPYGFNINMTVAEVMNSDMVAYLKEVVTQTGTAHKLTIELLESEGIEKYPEVAGFINDIKEIGCKVAIDDFGSGYSNFDHLLRLNIDYLKIDGSIISKIDSDRSALIIAETIANFASKLGIHTVAEYVHSNTVDGLLSRVGVDFAQGFHLGRPAAQLVAK